MPCFGQAADPQSKVWIESSCVDFLDHIEKATQDASFTDNGRIKLIRNRLIGPARDYFNQFAGKTFKEAREYLLDMFPDSTTHASALADIAKIKRQNGEHLSFLAIRIGKAINKLQKISTTVMSDAWREREKKELLLKCVPGSVRNFVKVETDTYGKLLKDILDYFELNTQHHLTRAEIDAEKLKGTKNVNAIKGESKGKGVPNKVADTNNAKATVEETNGDQCNVAAAIAFRPTSQGDTGGPRSQNNSDQQYAGYGRGRSNNRSWRGGRINSYRGRGRGDDQSRYGANFYCYVCGKSNHLARDCSNNYYRGEGNNYRSRGDSGNYRSRGGSNGSRGQPRRATPQPGEEGLYFATSVDMLSTRRMYA